MKMAPEIMQMLNDVAWHTMQVNRLADELNRRGISEDDIGSFLDDYQEFLELAHQVRGKAQI